MTSNAELAQRARQLADRELRGSLGRAAGLCCAVALGESRTVAGARKVLASWDGSERIKTAAVELLEQITTKEEAAP